LGQWKIYINISMQILLGITYEKDLSFEINILCFTVGLGLTKTAKGFGFWIK